MQTFEAAGRSPTTGFERIGSLIPGCCTVLANIVVRSSRAPPQFTRWSVVEGASGNSTPSVHTLVGRRRASGSSTPSIHSMVKRKGPAPKASGQSATGSGPASSAKGQERVPERLREPARSSVHSAVPSLRVGPPRPRSGGTQTAPSSVGLCSSFSGTSPRCQGSQPEKQKMRVPKGPNGDQESDKVRKTTSKTCYPSQALARAGSRGGLATNRTAPSK